MRQLGIYLIAHAQQLYIGKTQDFARRLAQHDSQKEFWSKAVVLTVSNKALHQGHVDYLEATLIAMAKERNEIEAVNRSAPMHSPLEESDLAFAARFLQEALRMLQILGFRHFEANASENASGSNDDVGSANKDEPSGPVKYKMVWDKLPAGSEFQFDGRWKATLRLDGEKVVVREGSQANPNEAPSFSVHFPHYAASRQKLIESELLVPKDDHLVFASDVSFASPSAAACTVCARAVNATAWKRPDGTTLQQLMLAAASAS